MNTWYLTITRRRPGARCWILWRPHDFKKAQRMFDKLVNRIGSRFIIGLYTNGWFKIKEV